jgi:hypothetical protein
MDKMKRLSSVVLAGAMLLAGWARAENRLPMMSADDLAAQLGGAADIDGATRGCKIKNFRKLIACELIAGRATVDNLVVNEDVVVYGNEEIAGNLTVDGNELVRGNVEIDGNLTVLGNYVPLTFNLQPGTNVISPVINGLSNDVQNFGSVLINLAPGDYNETNFSFTNQIQDVTIIGDTNPLAGVTFMQGGIYGGLAYNVQRQLNPEIGVGCNYNITFNTGPVPAAGTVMTVTTDTLACTDFTAANPNFSSLLAGRQVQFIGQGATGLTATVQSATGNTITFTTAVGGTLAGTTTDGMNSSLGVAFTVVPNVRINGPAGTSSFTGFKNLKLQGIYFSWEIGNVLYLGGVNTKMELSNNLLSDEDAGPLVSGIVLSANQAYNRQPNTFTGRPQIVDTCTPDFVFNTVIGGPGLQIFGASGTFSYAQFTASAMYIDRGSRIVADYSRFLNELQTDTAISVVNGSTLSFINGIVQDVVQVPNTNGIVVANSSTLVASDVTVKNFDVGLNVETASAGLVFGVTNPANFDGNTNDLELDGALTANINAYVSGTFGVNNSYVLK